jgi:radical SAM superfamily enzyme YgiQ (UPF0313 family)
MNRTSEREIILIQPPMVQLNGPYPAPYYLAAFLEKRGFKARVLDHSIGLFERIFCRRGLTLIFDHVRGRAGKAEWTKRTRSIVLRFLSEEDRWLAAIGRLTAFLRGQDREWGHLLSLANGVLPGGPRSDAFLAERGGEVPPDSAPLLASRLLEDLADFITVTVDSRFSLIRYLPALPGSPSLGFGDFQAVEKSLEGFILQNFYRPLLEEEWDRLRTSAPSSRLLLGLTIPFPGCLPGALFCAASAKARFGGRVETVAGGGYVNTELRFLKGGGFFRYFDHLSLDRGYGFLASLLSPVPGEEAAAIRAIDDEAARTVFPDYSSVDFSRYLLPVDDANPMHRLWSDGRWLKVYLAHGCYWHNCSFCDVTLDYIRSFLPVDPAALFSHLKEQAEKTGIRGVHLVDEAAPPASLTRLALLNWEAALPLSFWGNIRFDRAYTPDAAAVLAAGGLMGVSAGIEVASEKGLERLGKGLELRDIVRVCAAFKEAGVLVHAYLIYGYWDEDEEEIVNSAEIIRQFFAQGLLDSAFWHKFVLTRHSRIYAEKQRGLHGALKITGDGGGGFALNDLSFEGEERFDKYTEPLDRLLAWWMAGRTGGPVEKAFPFRVKPPSVPADLIRRLLDEYAGDRDRERAALPGNGGRVVFLGSRPVADGEGLLWRWRLEERRLKAAGPRIASLLEEASRGMGALEFYSRLEAAAGEAPEAARRAGGMWKILRRGGLVSL